MFCKRRWSGSSQPPRREDKADIRTDEEGACRNGPQDVRRATRHQFSGEEKIHIVRKGLRGKDSSFELCRREGISSVGWRGGARLVLVLGRPNGLAPEGSRRLLPRPDEMLSQRVV